MRVFVALLLELCAAPRFYQPPLPLPEQIVRMIEQPETLRDVLTFPAAIFQTLNSANRSVIDNTRSLTNDLKGGLFRPYLVEQLVPACGPFLDGSALLFSHQCGEAMASFILGWGLVLKNCLADIITLLELLFTPQQIEANPRHFSVIGLYAFAIEIEACQGKTTRDSARLAAAFHFVSHAEQAGIEDRLAAAPHLPGTMNHWIRGMAANPVFNTTRRTAVMNRENFIQMSATMFATGLPMELALLAILEIQTMGQSQRPQLPNTIRDLAARGLVLEDELNLFPEGCVFMDMADPEWFTACHLVIFPVSRMFTKIIAVYAGVSDRAMNAMLSKIGQAWANPVWVRELLARRDIVHILHQLIYKHYIRKEQLPETCQSGASLERCMDDLADIVSFKWRFDLNHQDRYEVLSQSGSSEDSIMSMLGSCFEFTRSFAVNFDSFADPVQPTLASLVDAIEATLEMDERVYDDMLVLSERDPLVFQKSATFFARHPGHPESHFVLVADLSPMESEKLWFDMIRKSPEMLFIRPMNDSVSLEFLGKFVRYALNTRRATGIPFDLDVIASAFFTGRGKETVWARSVKKGFDSFYLKESRVKFEMRSLPPLIYHGADSGLTPPEYAFPIDIRAWADMGLRPYHTVESDDDGREMARLTIRRHHILDDSLLALIEYADNGPERYKVRFEGEPGVDAGGPRREWLAKLGHKLFSPKTGLFVTNSEGKLELSPLLELHPNQPLISRHMSLIGKVLALAVMQNFAFGIEFTPPFYETLLGVPGEEYEDQELPWLSRLIARNASGDPTADAIAFRSGVEPQRFAYTVNLPLGQFVDVALKPRKPGIKTEADWDEYVTLVKRERMKVLAAPPEMKTAFDGLCTRWMSSEEMKDIILGDPFNVTDWRNATRTHQHQSLLPVYHWFWDILATKSQKEMRHLLSYWTGLSALPFGGFQAIEDGLEIRFNTGMGKLFKSRTCFNWLIVPLVSTREELEDIFRESLLLPLTFSDA